MVCSGDKLWSLEITSGQWRSTQSSKSLYGENDTTGFILLLPLHFCFTNVVFLLIFQKWTFGIHGAVSFTGCMPFFFSRHACWCSYYPSNSCYCLMWLVTGHCRILCFTISTCRYEVFKELPKNSFWDCWNRTVASAILDMIPHQQDHITAMEEGKRSNSDENSVFVILN